MFGVLCIYLLLGMLFAFAYGIVGDASAPTPSSRSTRRPTPPNFLYFSFATITTVGYGDLTAATDLGRSLAIAEALIGQIYLVTVVAAIVGGPRRPGGLGLTALAGNTRLMADERRTLRIALAQVNPTVGDIEGNARLISRLDRPRARGRRAAGGLPRADASRAIRPRTCG